MRCRTASHTRAATPMATRKEDRYHIIFFPSRGIRKAPSKEAKLIIRIATKPTPYAGRER